VAAGQHEQFLLLWQQLDVHALTHRLPGQPEQARFQPGEPPLGRSDQITDGWVGLAHLAQHLLGGDPAIHHPDALRLAVLRLDPLQKAT